MTQISNYLRRAVDRYPVLSEQDQLDLLQRAKDGDTEARELLITTNLRLVIYIAQRLGVPYHWDLDDLVSEGIQGIDYSIDKYNAKEDTKLSTYFWNAIKWKILKFKEEVLTDTLSLNAIIGSDDEEETEFLDLVADPASDKLRNEMEARSDLIHLLGYLSEQEQIIIILSHGLFGFEVYGLESLSRLLNLTNEGVRQNQKRAIKKMQMLPEVPPTNPLVSRKKIQTMLDSGNILSKREKMFSKRDEKNKPIEVIHHDYIFRSGIRIDKFQDEFGDQIRSDYKNGCSIRMLAIKYNCPRSQIDRAVREQSCDQR